MAFGIYLVVLVWGRSMRVWAHENRKKWYCHWFRLRDKIDGSCTVTHISKSFVYLHLPLNISSIASLNFDARSPASGWVEVGEQRASVAMPRIRKNRSRLILVGSMLRGMVEVKGGDTLDEDLFSALISECLWSLGGSIPSKPNNSRETYTIIIVAVKMPVFWLMIVNRAHYIIIME